MFFNNYLKIEGIKPKEEISLCTVEGQNKFTFDKGILREKKVYSMNQEQSKESFGFKWKKRDTYESDAVTSKMHNWLLEKYFANNIKNMKKIVPKGCKFLDAGCGAGFSAIALFDTYINEINYLGVDISEAVDTAKQRFEEKGLNGEFMQCDLGKLPFSEPVFDVIFSEGVLHHTDSTENAIKQLAKLLLPNGKFMFYVYVKKAPIREFSDDYIRKYLEDKTDEEAWEALEPLTKLGKALGDMNCIIDIPEDIPYLGVKKGSINIQRLFYWNIFKAFYDEKFSIEEMNHINFDWYRPMNCHRQTPEEVHKWCVEAGMTIEEMKVEEAGITVIATKN